MPSKNKKQSANQHDKRHESGIAEPTRRLVRPKSSGHLNGHASGAALSVDPVDSDPLLNSSQARAQPGPDGATIHTAAAAPMHIADQISHIFGEEALRGTAISKLVEMERDQSKSTNGTSTESSSQATSTDAARIDASQDLSNSELTTTVIKPAPLADIIAILLLLLSLPPHVLTLIDYVFVILTFSTPSPIWSMSSLLSLPDWLHSHSGNPSLLTMILVDLLILFVWSIFPRMWKDSILDLAQAVVAVSLGGGAVGNNGMAYISTCMVIVWLFHLCRHNGFRRLLLTSVSWIDWGPLRRLNPDSSAWGENPGVHDYVRILVEIHIIAQGIVRFVRRHMGRKQDLKSAGNKRSDSDAATIALASATPPTNDLTVDGARTTSTDGRPPGPSPAQKDVREKSISSGKRRRKQATHVRSQQPFWAAIASTKISVSKDIEQPQASQDVKEAAKRDTSYEGKAMDHAEDDRVWISRVDDTEVWFCATMLEAVRQSDDGDQQESESEDETPKPLHIRVNGADWKFAFREGDGTWEGKPVTVGKILGLTPSTNYHLEFVEASDRAVIYSVNLRTRPVASSDLGAGLSVSQQPQEPSAPSSPTSTLKKSVAAAQSKLQEKRTQTRRAKRDYRAAESAMEKEIDNLKSRLSSRGGSDDKQRQRRTQLGQSIRQAEEVTRSIESQIASLVDVPKGDREISAARKQRWLDTGSRIASLREELENAKVESDRQESSARAENLAVQQKREKLQSRLNRINQIHDELVSAAAKTFEDNARHDRERATMVLKRRREAHELQRKLHEFQTQTQEFEARTAFLSSQSYQPDTSQVLQKRRHLSIPSTPETSHSMPFPSRFSHTSQSFLSLSQTPTQPPIGTPLGHSGPPSARTRTKPRSSSMLSNVSAFTDDQAANVSSEPASDISWSHPETIEREGKNGSMGSARPESGNGSQRDSISPGQKMSPIGTGRGSPKNQRP